MVTANQGECLDALVWRATGQGADAVDAVLAATPVLSTIASALPAGLAVAIPDLPANPVERALVQLWD
jgi:phage tail protein X